MDVSLDILVNWSIINSYEAAFRSLYLGIFRYIVLNMTHLLDQGHVGVQGMLFFQLVRGFRYLYKTQETNKSRDTSTLSLCCIYLGFFSYFGSRIVSLEELGWEGGFSTILQVTETLFESSAARSVGTGVVRHVTDLTPGMQDKWWLLKIFERKTKLLTL